MVPRKDELGGECKTKMNGEDRRLKMGPCDYLQLATSLYSLITSLFLSLDISNC